MKKFNHGFELLRSLFTFIQSATVGRHLPVRSQPTIESHELPSVSDMGTISDNPEIASLRPVKEFFVVWDALGDGRLVGVFKTEQQAQDIQKLNPFYYRHYKCYLGEPTDLALHWLDEPAKQKLKDICRNYRS